MSDKDVPTEEMEFDPLTPALDELWDLDFDKLPAPLQSRVRQVFSVPKWDSLDRQLRRRRALEWDSGNDPRLDPIEERYFTLAYWIAEYTERLEKLQREERQLDEALESEDADQIARIWGLGQEEACDMVNALKDYGELVTRSDADEPTRVVSPPALGAEDSAPTASYFRNRARHAANARYSQPGGSREKRVRVLEEWASGKFKTKTECAQEMARELSVSFDTARRWLRRAPPPVST